MSSLNPDRPHNVVPKYKEMDKSKYCPIDLMDQALPDMQNRQIPPPPSHNLPAQPILPPRCPEFEKPRRPPPRSAGPGAVRVSLREYENNVADDGTRFCHRCLCTGHVGPDCPFLSCCAKCTVPPTEVGHSTKYHKKSMYRNQNL